MISPVWKQRCLNGRHSNLKYILEGTGAEMSGICMFTTTAAKQFANLSVQYSLVIQDTQRFIISIWPFAGLLKAWDQPWELLWDGPGFGPTGMQLSGIEGFSMNVQLYRTKLSNTVIKQGSCES